MFHHLYNSQHSPLRGSLHLSAIPGTTDTMNCTCWFDKVIPIYSIVKYPRSRAIPRKNHTIHYTEIHEISDQISCS
jgi:hypothetical protein